MLINRAAARNYASKLMPFKSRQFTSKMITHLQINAWYPPVQRLSMAAFKPITSKNFGGLLVGGFNHEERD